MAIQVHCRGCGQLLVAANEHAGSQVSCPQCGQGNRLPGRRTKKSKKRLSTPLLLGGVLLGAVAAGMLLMFAVVSAGNKPAATPDPADVARQGEDSANGGTSNSGSSNGTRPPTPEGTSPLPGVGQTPDGPPAVSSNGSSAGAPIRDGAGSNGESPLSGGDAVVNAPGGSTTPAGSGNAESNASDGTDRANGSDPGASGNGQRGLFGINDAPLAGTGNRRNPNEESSTPDGPSVFGPRGVADQPAIEPNPSDLETPVVEVDSDLTRAAIISARRALEMTFEAAIATAEGTSAKEDDRQLISDLRALAVGPVESDAQAAAVEWLVYEIAVDLVEDTEPRAELLRQAKRDWPMGASLLDAITLSADTAAFGRADDSLKALVAPELALRSANGLYELILWDRYERVVALGRELQRLLNPWNFVVAAEARGWADTAQAAIAARQRAQRAADAADAITAAHLLTFQTAHPADAIPINVLLPDDEEHVLLDLLARSSAEMNFSESTQAAAVLMERLRLQPESVRPLMQWRAASLLAAAARHHEATPSDRVGATEQLIGLGLPLRPQPTNAAAFNRVKQQVQDRVYCPICEGTGTVVRRVEVGQSRSGNLSRPVFEDREVDCDEETCDEGRHIWANYASEAIVVARAAGLLTPDAIFEREQAFAETALANLAEHAERGDLRKLTLEPTAWLNDGAALGAAVVIHGQLDQRNGAMTIRFEARDGRTHTARVYATTGQNGLNARRGARVFLIGTPAFDPFDPDHHEPVLLECRGLSSLGRW